MKIAVLIRQVPDTETKIAIKGDKNGVEENGVKWIMSPYDENAVEEAIKIGGETTVISMGPARVVESIRTALAMGIQKAIHVDTKDKYYDAYATSVVLAKVLKEGGFDLVLCGKQAIDYNNSSVVPMVAEILQAGHINFAESITVNGGSVKATRKAAGGTVETFEAKTPVVIGCEKSLNQPRYASLPGIMKAKTKPVDVKDAEGLLEGQTSLTSLTNFTLPPEKQAGKIIAGDAAQQAKELVRLLREEAKVI